MWRKSGICAVLSLTALALTTCMTTSSAAVTSDTDVVEVYSSAVNLGDAARTKVDPLISSEFAEKLAREKPTLEAPGASGAAIAEPGTLGLMALAGLMGGAMVMRHRLG